MKILCACVIGCVTLILYFLYGAIKGAGHADENMNFKIKENDK